MGDDVERRGQERRIQNELNVVDDQQGDRVNDNPGGNRNERRRANFTDVHGDEDGDPNTRERPGSSAGPSKTTTS